MTREVRRTGAVAWWRTIGWSVAAAVLLLPLAAMQFTAEVHWTGSDFVFAGVLIGGAGGAFELVVRARQNGAYRAGMALALAAAFLLVWLNAAVGIIGSEDNPLNLLYGAVVLVALVGALAARFGARGMAHAMTAAAIAQALVGIVAITAGANEPPGPAGLGLLNGFFVALFSGSAWLFRRAADAA